ncbi:unnamed protein product [Cochlearia groenlandica]
MVSSDDNTIHIESGGDDDDLYIDDDEADSDDLFTGENIENDSTSSKQSHTSYIVLKEEDIQKRQKIDIERVSTILSISKVEAIILLLHYRWNVSKVEDEWFTNEDKVRGIVGLLKNPNNGIEVNSTHECGICFESYEIVTVSCGHYYCNTCWIGYITTKINDGPGCLVVKCPDPSCSFVVGQDLIEKVVTQEDKEKYYRYFLRSYVEESTKKIKWCPSPGCEHAVEFSFESGGRENYYDVSCFCSYEFCWNCSEEAHSPVDCVTVSKWLLKNVDEWENTNWILANSKPCPKCKRPIQKSQGCNNMKCSICKCRFCWNCLCFLPHKDKACNTFKRSDQETGGDTKREKAKDAINKYTHYYERWANNHSSRLIAMQDLKILQSVKLKKLSDRHCLLESRFQFIVEAWLQIIECRRVLKWTYAYGYYLPEQERAKKRFFEYLQGEAETGLERLHHCVEKKKIYEFALNSEEENGLTNDYKIKLIGLTKVTKTYFENLVKALENGLVDVETKSTTKHVKRQRNN